MKAAIAACVLLSASLTFAQSSSDAQAAYIALIEAGKLSQSYFNLLWSSSKPAPGFAEESGKALAKVVELEQTLKALYEADVANADFYWGTYKLNQGQAVARVPDAARKHFEDALAPLRHAASRGEPSAAWNLALMFANGWGVQASKLAASEWYVRAGEWYARDGDRDTALASLERAEGLDPRSAGVRRLRNKLRLQ
jgi:tetratricopeptide (TPR) repeat protein